MEWDVEAQDGQPILVAIHGTWAEGAGWTQKDASLLKRLITEWPSAGLCRFKWSGVNGTNSRLAAAEALAKELDKLSASCPHSKIVTLSHSHGGNIVAWASTQLARRLTGSVYMNTPFIEVLPQAQPKPQGLRVALLLASSILAPFLTLTLEAVPFLKQWAHRVGVDVYGIAVVICILIGVLLLVTVVPPIGRARTRLALLSTSARNIDKQLVVSVVGDEVSAALAAVYFSQWIWNKAFLFVLVASGSWAIGAKFLPTMFPWRIAALLWSVLFLFGIPSLIVLFSTFAYGIVHSLIALDTPVVVAPAPIGLTYFGSVEWTEQDRVRHSLIYDAPYVISGISRFINDVFSDVPR